MTTKLSDLFLRELTAARRRLGWRRLQVLLSREGVHLNRKKLRRHGRRFRVLAVVDDYTRENLSPESHFR